MLLDLGACASNNDLYPFEGISSIEIEMSQVIEIEEAQKLSIQRLFLVYHSTPNSNDGIRELLVSLSENLVFFIILILILVAMFFM